MRVFPDDLTYCYKCCGAAHPFTWQRVSGVNTTDSIAGMRIFIAVLISVGTSLAAQAQVTAQAHTPLPSQRLMELRSAVQQSQLRTVGAPAGVAPRQLSAEERAILRRQVQEQSAKSRS